MALTWGAHAQDAQDSVYEDYTRDLRAAQETTPLTSAMFGDQVGLYSGGTQFDVTDINLPGNGGLPVRLGRHFLVQKAGQQMGSLGGFGEWDLEVPYIDGHFAAENGWEVQVPTNVNQGTYSRCSVQTPPYTIVSGTNEPVYQIWDGNLLYIPGEVADEELLLNTETKLPAVADGNSYPWVTKSLYRAMCAPSTANGYPGESFVVVSPSGVRYTMNWMLVNTTEGASYAVPNPTGNGYTTVGANRSRIFLLATQVTDRFGNWVKYNYNASSQLTSITASDGREIDITWSGNNISSATAGTRTWQYAYTASGTLQSVTLPDGSQWTYAVASGSLVSVRTPPEDPPPSQHCQIDPLARTGSFVYVIGAPSGAQGTFTFNYQRNYRTYVPQNSCTYSNPDVLYPPVVDHFDDFALVSKQISGAGLTTQNWNYSYLTNFSAGGETYYTASGAYPNPTETYIPTGCTDCAVSKTVTVTGPTEITKSVFGVQYGNNEGRLLQTEVDSPSGTMMHTVTYTYLDDSQIGNEPFPDNVGLSMQPIYKNPMVGRQRPVTTTTVTQDGDTYTHQNVALDVFARPYQVNKYNSIAGQLSLEEQTTYYDNLALWVLGQPQQVVNMQTGETETQNVYTPGNATLYSSAHFGETTLTYTYNPAGQLASFTDGNGNATSLGNYYRGIPQLIQYPDNTSQQATVDDYGDITAVTDQLGHTTNYSYNAVGWPSQIIYPTGDEVAWNPKIYSFAYVTTAERGIPGGHWRRTVNTGNGTDVTYFDAMLRPLLSDTSIAGTANSDISIASSYDPRGLTTFTSYPVSGTPDLSAITVGTHKTYDALKRLTSSQQDSELGTLTTTTAYLSGAGVQVTDPNNNVTTTYAQVFDEPSYDKPIQVQAPVGVTQTITRDYYGNPLSITQSGLYNGTESDSVTKTLTYDSYHRLCRTTEPESGDTVMAYDGANNLQWSAAGLSITGTGCGQSQVATAAQTQFTYDPMNRAKTIMPPAGTQSTTYLYWPTGQLESATSGATVWNGVYNYRNMLTGESLNVVGQNALGLGYAHDANGSLSVISYPDGENVSYAPDALGRPTQVGSYASGITYYPNGQVQGFTYGNGTSYLAQQNARQLTSNFSYGNGSTLNVSEDLSYDSNGNILTMQDLVNGQRSKTFQYDALNRLTSAVAPSLWGTESYQYDPLNNLRVRLTGGQTHVYNYGPTNLLANITQAGTTIDSFGYDSQGNETNRNGNALVFDQKSQLLQIPGFDSYQYDAAGRRTVKTSAASGASTYTFYDHAGQLMYQLEPAISKSTDFIYLGTKLIAQDVSLKLSAPGAITFDANPNNGSYTVSWGAVPTATGYTLQESANSGAWVTVSSGSGTSAPLSGRAGGSYVYQVQACASSGCGPWTASATLGVRPTLPTITVPGGTINGTYTVSWTAPATAATYMVQESLNGGAWTTIASSTSATSVSRPGTTSGSYTYQVAAYNSYGTRGPATSAAVNVDTTYGVLPAAPASLTVPATSNTGSAGLSWSAATLAATYTVQQSANGGTSWAGVYSSSATTATVAGLGNGSYVYRVQACNTYGCSAWVAGSTTLVVTLPPTAAPALIDPTGSTTGSFGVSWSNVAGATSYTLQQQVNGGAWTNVQASSATSWSASGYGSGSYGYRAQGCNAGGCGPWSNTSVTVVLLPPPTPASINVPASSGGPISISWSASATATTYGLDQSINGGAWSQIYAGTGTSTALNAAATGSYSYRAYACNSTGCSGYAVSNPVSVIVVVPIAINGQSYGASYGVPSGKTNATAIGFAISGTVWYVFKITPVVLTTAVTMASGPLPVGAVTVRYTWTDAGVPSGDSDAIGSISNGAASPVAVSSNPTSQYTTGAFGAKSPIRAHSYHLEVDFFNAGGSLVSTSTCTMTAGVAGTN